MPDSLLIGLSGLLSHQRAIEVTSHNIANATTPGYTRQQISLIPNQPEENALGQLGRGVQADAVRRAANDLVIERLRQAGTEDARLTTLANSLKAAELSFSEPGDTGLSTSLNRIFSGFDDLAANPESTALRSAAISQLETFSNSLNSLNASLQSQRDDLRNVFTDEVDQVNSLTSQIVTVNQQVRDQTLLGNVPNDFLDRRDQLVGELSRHLTLRVRTDPSDNSIMIDSGGLLLVGRDYAETLSVGTTLDGSLTLLAASKVGVNTVGGSLGALVDLHNSELPKLIAGLDSMASTLALELNARQSTGNNQVFRVAAFASEYGIETSKTALNFDDAQQIQSADGGPGLPKVFLPSFTDANGNPVARNLTINVYDPVSDSARKYVLRYDPATGGGIRSLDDLVSAINSGRSTLSGGFTLYPPNAGGIAGVTARKVGIDGAQRLELTASAGQSIDFSRALDLNPSADAWSSGTTTVSGSDPALAGKRVVFTVVGGALQASTRDPQNGIQIPYGLPLVLGGAAGVIGNLSLALTPGAGNYQNGDSFAVDLDEVGGIIGTTHTASQAWTAGDAEVAIKGRYTGDITFAPGREWSMRVVTGGTIGAASGAPLVEFTYYNGSAAAPVQQKLLKVLDNSAPAGSPVEIADGVYAVFGAGNLSTAGNQTDFIVDSAPDQARLLPALGINTIYSGTTAATLRVSRGLLKDPNLLGVGSTREAGDNSNVLDQISVRQGQLFSKGAQTVDDYYNSTVAGLGIHLADVKRLQDNQSALAVGLENLRQQSSGVSIDEEVSQLILQQQAYAAAARVITTARENISTLLDLVR